MSKFCRFLTKTNFAAMKIQFLNLPAHCCSFKWNCFSPAAPTQDWCPDFDSDCYCISRRRQQCLKCRGQCWLCDLAQRSTHCGSWVLAPCQAKQNLIPSAGKARPPLSNPMLSSLVVWSAHTAVPPCVSPLGWKKMLLVGMSHPALFMGLYNTHTANAKK